MNATLPARDAELSPSSSVHARSTPRTHRVWLEGQSRFSSDRITRMRHDFHEHPLMQLSSLESLAKRLMPSGQCRFMAPGATQASVFSHHDHTHDGRSLEDVFRRIEEPGAWIALYNVETDPSYARFLEEVQSAVRPVLRGQQPGIFNVGGFIFISAPPSVTPFHIDREQNFWLQVRGQKTLDVWDHRDRDVVPAADVEEFILYGSLDRVKLQERFKERSHTFHAGPGDAIYFPSTSPHMTRSDVDWVKPGDGVSISIGTVFYSEVTRRHARVHQLNQALRKLGISADPRAPGESALLDRLKEPFGKLVGAARYKMRSGKKVPPGCY